MKLLIVDDDRYAREGILSSLSLAELGIDAVMQTSDGKTALEITRWYGPDIIITDICMPRMNGMEFAASVRQIQPECQLIFITGFAEIAYLKQAIELSAVAFVEKPLKADELVKAVENAAARHRERLFANQRAESLTKLRRHQLAAMLTRTEKNMQEVRTLCGKLNFPQSGRFQCLAIIAEQQDLRGTATALESICGKMGFDAVTELRENRQMHLVLACRRQPDQVYHQLLDALLERYRDLRIGEGMPVQALERIAESRRAACAMLEGAFFDEDARLFPYRHDGRGEHRLTVDVYAQFARLLNEDRAGLYPWLDAILTEIIREKSERVGSVRSLVLSIAKELYTRYPELAGKVYGISHANELDEYVYSVASASNYRKFFQEIFWELDKLDAATSRFAQVVRDAKRYIAQSFSQPDLNLQRIASQVNFSPAYLNALFRTETGMTVKQYLIDCRMSEAKRLLRDPKIRIAEIARYCGYSNSNYFAKAFKELTGLTPGEYREQTL